MFDELKEVKCFKEMKDLKSLQVKAEAYLEPKRASMMKIFWKKWPATYYFRKNNSIIDACLGSKVASENNEISKTKLTWNKLS